MLDKLKANAKTGAINDAFFLIGRTGDTAMPRSSHASERAGKVNTEPSAYEYWVASELLRHAEARKRAAHKAAVKHGVIFDHEAEPLEAGDSKKVYDGDVVAISVVVTEPSSKLNTAAFFADLEKAGVARKLIDQLTALHTTHNRAPHKFTAVLVTS